MSPRFINSTLISAIRDYYLNNDKTAVDTYLDQFIDLIPNLIEVLKEAFNKQELDCLLNECGKYHSKDSCNKKYINCAIDALLFKLTLENIYKSDDCISNLHKENAVKSFLISLTNEQA